MAAHFIYHNLWLCGHANWKLQVSFFAHYYSSSSSSCYSSASSSSVACSGYLATWSLCFALLHQWVICFGLHLALKAPQAIDLTRCQRLSTKWSCQPRSRKKKKNEPSQQKALESADIDNVMLVHCLKSWSKIKRSWLQTGHASNRLNLSFSQFVFAKNWLFICKIYYIHKTNILFSLLCTSRGNCEAASVAGICSHLIFLCASLSCGWLSAGYLNQFKSFNWQLKGSELY